MERKRNAPEEMHTSPTSPRPWYRKKRFVIPLGLFVLVAFVSALTGGNDENEVEAASSPTSAAEPDTPPPATPVSSPEPQAPVEEGSAATLESLDEYCEHIDFADGVSCQETFDAAAPFIRSFSGKERLTDLGVAIEVQIVCSAVASGNSMTYDPVASAYFPELVGFLVPRYCLGDPDIFTPKSVG